VCSSDLIGGNTPSDTVPGFATSQYYDTNKSPIAPPGSTNQPRSSVQDLQALSQGQNTLQNVLGAVGQSLVPVAAGFLGSALAGPADSLSQRLLSNFAPALAGGTPQAGGGPFFPTGPTIVANGTENPTAQTVSSTVVDYT
jgi:hypothetical protein